MLKYNTTIYEDDRIVVMLDVYKDKQLITDNKDNSLNRIVEQELNQYSELLYSKFNYNDQNKRLLQLQKKNILEIKTSTSQNKIISITNEEKEFNFETLDIV